MSVHHQRLALVLWLGVSPASAYGQSTDMFEQGVEFTRRFHYDEALASFEQILVAPDATAAQRTAALERIGGIHFNQNDQDQARHAFQRLLDVDPGHELPADQYAPPLVEFFEGIRSGYEPQVERPPLTVRVADDVAAGVATVQVELSSPSKNLDRARFRSRWAGDSEYQESPLEPQGNSFQGRLPLLAEPGMLEYYVEICAPSGYVLNRSGSPDAPHQQRVAGLQPASREEETPVARARPWHRSWWFWTIVGVVVAGGVAGAVGGTLASQEDPVQGSLGTVTLE